MASPPKPDRSFCARSPGETGRSGCGFLPDAEFNSVPFDGADHRSLAAFINAVEAQRGNKLTDNQADELIASAEGIQTSLNCGN